MSAVKIIIETDLTVEQVVTLLQTLPATTGVTVEKTAPDTTVKGYPPPQTEPAPDPTSEAPAPTPEVPAEAPVAPVEAPVVQPAA